MTPVRKWRKIMKFNALLTATLTASILVSTAATAHSLQRMQTPVGNDLAQSGVQTLVGSARPTLVDGTGYNGRGTATGGPVGGLPNRN